MENYKRRNYFIDKPFQTKFIIKFCIIVIASSVLIGASIFYLSKSFTTVAIENAHVTVKNTSDFMLPIVVETLALVTLFSAVSVIALTLFTSHQIAGPLFRLKRDIEAFKNGSLNTDFRTRSTDQLKDLSDSLADMGKVMTGKHADLRNRLSDLKASLQSSGMDKEAIMKKVNELESAISYFKI